MNKSRLKKALLFTYYWPPASGPGVQRWLKFVKFLPEFGWDVIVVTPKKGSYPNTDPTLLEDIPKHTIIEKTGTIEPFRLFNILSGKPAKGKTSTVGMSEIKGSQTFVKRIAAYVRANIFIPDARLGWVPFAKSRGKNILKSQPIDLIITTGPPHSTHLIGLKLSQKYNLPWIADFRDPWTSIYYNKFLPRSERAKKKDAKLESRVLAAANSTIVVSNGLKKEFQDRAQDIHVIPNGYDSEDFTSLDNQEKGAYFKLSYIGNLKGNQNCKTVWKAIRELRAVNESFRHSFKLSFTGNIHEEVLQTFKEYGIDDIIETLPFVEHQEAVKRMYESDALLFPIPQAENNKQIITGKIFEYLASQTPLLSVGPLHGDAARILEDCNRFPMLDYDDEVGIKQRILTLFEQWEKPHKQPKHSGTEHEKFSRKKLTQTLAEILNDVA
ncbi:MAG: glycosyltransferase family 4 protein [Balneolaceae bacterium]